MRGSIIKRSKDAKNYTIVLDMGKDPNTDKRKRQWITAGASKRDAEKRLAELLHQLDSGMYMKPGKTTTADFFERQLTDYAKLNLSPRSYERYAGIVRTHLIPLLGRMPLTQLRPEHIQNHYADRINVGLSARTVRYHHVVIHKALETAIKWGLLSRNVADGVDVPRAKLTEMQTWNQDELNRFLDVAKDSR